MRPVLTIASLSIILSGEQDIDHISHEMRAVVESEWPGWRASCHRRNRRVEMMPSLTDSQTRSSSVARRPMAPIGFEFRTAGGRVPSPPAEQATACQDQAGCTWNITSGAAICALMSVRPNKNCRVEIAHAFIKPQRSILLINGKSPLNTQAQPADQLRI